MAPFNVDQPSEDLCIVVRMTSLQMGSNTGSGPIRMWPELQAVAHDASAFTRSLRSRRFRSSQTESVNQKAPLCSVQLRAVDQSQLFCFVCLHVQYEIITHENCSYFLIKKHLKNGKKSAFTMSTKICKIVRWNKWFKSNISWILKRLSFKSSFWWKMLDF